MRIQLTPEQERVIGRAIEAGLIGSPDEIVGLGVEAIQQRLKERGAPSGSTSTEQWLAEFHAWVHSHSTAAPLLSDEDVSRDSIYGTRGR